MRRLYRALLVPGSVSILFGSAYLLMLAFAQWLVWRLELLIPLKDPKFTELTLEPLWRLSEVVLGMWAVAYGVIRSHRFHPVANLQYWKWLANSPWNAQSPLPLGPAHLVGQDAAFVGIWMLLSAFISHAHPAIPAICVLGSYLVLTTSHLASTRQRTHVGVLLTMFPVTWYTLDHPWVILIVLIIGYAVALHGLSQSWRSFPWDLDNAMKRGGRRATAPVRLGWPFDRLNGHIPPAEWKPATKALVSLITGWYVFSFVYCAIEPDRRLLGNIVAIILTSGALAALFRCIVYCSSVLPPLSFLARIRLSHFVIPAYDYVLIAPLIIALTAIGGPMALWYVSTPPSLLAGVMTSTLVAMLCGLPPSLKHWQLTGHGRINIPNGARASLR